MTKWITVTLIAMSLGLSACGKKGPLDPPPGYEDQQDKEE